MKQQEFYELPEVQEQLNIQRTSPYGSPEHKAAFYAVGTLAVKYDVAEEYFLANGGTDY
mgnify:CR=1 FL=1